MTDADGLAGFYGSTYPRLLGVLNAVADTRADAEEALQDAYVQLVPRWAKVSAYDDPEGWVRHVALRRLISLKRRRSVAFAARLRLVQPDMAAPTGDRVDVDAVMRQIPVAFRAVLVLHHGLGLPIAEVAHALDIPEGTVKSRLSRARARFASLYEQEPTPHA